MRAPTKARQPLRATDSRDAAAARWRAREHLIEERGGENFWETGWLRHQIERTKHALEALS
jgi:hypothetical protein